ncbi:MAG TPA: outer membrane lipoprotein chaperone LolA [Pseudomonadales bacterium]
MLAVAFASLVLGPTVVAAEPEPAATSAFAADREALAERLQTIERYVATFTQTVFGVRGEILEESQGRVWLERPRFKWEVEEPYPQVLVTEGAKLKLYDPDLEQLTVRPLAEALKDTPVSLLTRDAVEIADDFQVMHIADAGGDSFIVQPNSEETLYREIVLHFEGGGLRGLDILDHLGQRTEIRFRAQPDAVIAPGTFTLEVPPGTDVVGG